MSDEEERAAVVAALIAMEPYVQKIARCAVINDDMGRVVIGQTEAARQLARLHDEALAHLKPKETASDE